MGDSAEDQTQAQDEDAQAASVGLDEPARPRLVSDPVPAADDEAPDGSDEDSRVMDAQAFEDHLGVADEEPEEPETAEEADEPEEPPVVAADGEDDREEEDEEAGPVSEAEPSMTVADILAIDPELVAETAKWGEQRARFHRLITSAEHGRDDVKPEIFGKVLEDYRLRLAEAEEQYDPLRTRVLEHSRRVMEEERRVRSRLEEINDVVEELRFRLQLGEFEEEEFESRRQKSTGELTELDERLGRIEALYRSVRELLGSEASEVLEDRGATRSLPDLASASAAEQVAQPLVTAPIGPSAEAPHDFNAAAIPPAAGQDPTMPPLPSPSPLPSHSDAEGRTVIVATGERLLDQVLGQTSNALRLTPLTPGLGSAMPIVGEQILLGRSTSCDVVLKGATVSRRHALVRTVEGVVSIEDISSGGGVLVNGERISGRRPLAEGDVVQIGNASLRIDPVGV